MLTGHGINKILKVVKIGVVGAKLSGQFPYPLYRVQLGAISREELQGQGTAMLLRKGLRITA